MHVTRPTLASSTGLRLVAMAGLVVGLLALPWQPGSRAQTAGGESIRDIAMAGEAHSARQDLATPTQVHLGRVPRAFIEVSTELTRGFAAFYDPGFLLRFGIGDSTGQEPTYAGCLFPKSPRTPTDDTRGQPPATSAQAICGEQEGHAVGQFSGNAAEGAAGPSAQMGVSRATVDAVGDGETGETEVVAHSYSEDVLIADVVGIAQIESTVRVSTTGKRDGAEAEATTTIGKLSVAGTPISVGPGPLEQLEGPLEQLGDIVSPVGEVTFDVVPGDTEVGPDGLSARGTASQLLVTIRNGERTVSYGLGFATARTKAILGPELSAGAGADDLTADVGDDLGTTDGEDDDGLESTTQSSDSTDLGTTSSPQTPPSGPEQQEEAPQVAAPETEDTEGPAQGGGESQQAAGEPAGTAPSGPGPVALATLFTAFGLSLIRYLTWSQNWRPVAVPGDGQSTRP